MCPLPAHSIRLAGDDMSARLSPSAHSIRLTDGSCTSCMRSRQPPMPTQQDASAAHHGRTTSSATLQRRGRAQLSGSEVRSRDSGNVPLISHKLHALIQHIHCIPHALERRTMADRVQVRWADDPLSCALQNDYGDRLRQEVGPKRGGPAAGTSSCVLSAPRRRLLLLLRGSLPRLRLLALLPS